MSAFHDHVTLTLTFGLTRLVCRHAVWLNILLCFEETVLFPIELEAFS